ncbi:MAG: DUF393 domain-containing protein [Candidatus Melainabacteria bacterium]|nr:DUF393 domain-containing protein [Candidatus Melainabacteria bacterium]
MSLLKLILLLALIYNSNLTVLAKDPLVNDTSSNNSKPKIIGKYYWIIYDNVCPYCKEASTNIKQLDWEGRFKFVSYRDPMTYIMFPFLSEEECEKDIHMVTPKGDVLVGYKVFRTIIDNLTATKILNPLLQNNFAEQKLNEIYEKMVAKRTCYYEKTPSCNGKEEANHTGEATTESSSTTAN